MARFGIVLQAIDNRPATDHRQINIERDRVGLVHARQPRPVSPRRATTPLKPVSRAISSRMRAKARSSSTIRNTRSPGWIASRSSSISLAPSSSSSARAASAGGAGSRLSRFRPELLRPRAGSTISSVSGSSGRSGCGR